MNVVAVTNAASNAVAVGASAEYADAACVVAVCCFCSPCI